MHWIGIQRCTVSAGDADRTEAKRPIPWEGVQMKRPEVPRCRRDLLAADAVCEPETRQAFNLLCWNPGACQCAACSARAYSSCSRRGGHVALAPWQG